MQGNKELGIQFHGITEKRNTKHSGFILSLQASIIKIDF